MVLGEKRLHRLVYVSASAPDLSKSDLIDIARAAQTKNAKLRVTGVLLHVEGEFFQVLEGPAGAVEDVFASICQDRRNQWVTPLLRERPYWRVFKTWSMGCFDMRFKDLPSDLFFEADWEGLRLRLNLDHRSRFYRFLEQFYRARFDYGRVASF